MSETPHPRRTPLPHRRGRALHRLRAVPERGGGRSPCHGGDARGQRAALCHRHRWTIRNRRPHLRRLPRRSGGWAAGRRDRSTRPRSIRSGAPMLRVVTRLCGRPGRCASEGSTGGVLTALGAYLIESGRVAFVLHAKASEAHPTFGERHVSDSDGRRARRHGLALRSHRAPGRLRRGLGPGRALRLYRQTLRCQRAAQLRPSRPAGRRTLSLQAGAGLRRLHADAQHAGLPGRARHRPPGGHSACATAATAAPGRPGWRRATAG